MTTSVAVIAAMAAQLDVLAGELQAGFESHPDAVVADRLRRWLGPQGLLLDLEAEVAGRPTRLF